MSLTPPDAALQEIEDRIDRVLTRQQAHAREVARRGVRERVAAIRRIEHWILEHRDRIHEALAADFGKPVPETDITEVLVPLMECRHTCRNLRRWMRPHRVPAPLVLLGTRSWVRCEPRGTVLILAPFNYPFLLCIHPLVSALAAGNTVVLKPSEMTPHTARLIEEMVAGLFAEEEVAVFNGGIEVATTLLRRRFDHIFFTGSPRVGSIVMRAAAEHHATITLELGGKSPVVVDRTADLRAAADKIVWGRFQNAGQTCIAPDYVLVEAVVEDRLVRELKAALERRYGPEAGQKSNPDLARVVDTAHLDRLSRLIDEAVSGGARVCCGGDRDDSDRWLAPTILTGVRTGMAVMQEEIFGPVLPVLSWRDREEALAVIRGLPRPLALYLFSRDPGLFHDLLQDTSSGAVCHNDLLVHFLHPHLPFGGVNTSGQGAYHGRYGFREFSHERAVVRRGRFDPLRWFYPPYDGRVRRLIGWAVRYL